MINLLPPEEKAKVLSEKREKMVIVLGIVVIVPLLCLALVLLSIRFYLLGEIESQKATLTQAQKEYQTPDFLTYKEIMQKNDKALTTLVSFYKKEADISDVLKMISGITRPQNLYFTDLSIDRNKDGTIKAIASGFSGSREDLLAFQKNMNETQQIKNIIFSPESWVAPQNVTFKVTFDIKQ